jgi:N utilization substance protein A
VDAVGACVGVRGSRIKNIVDELGGEKIDIVRWNESSQILIGNALKPAEVTEVALCFELGRATVVVNDDQLSLAIGKRGQNVRLAARLTGWDVDILTPVEFQAGVQRLDRSLKSVDGVTQEMVDKIIALGLIDVRDIEEVGAAPLMEELGFTEEMAQQAVTKCATEAKLVAVEQEAKRATDASARAKITRPNALEAALAAQPATSAAPEEAAAENTDSSTLPGAMEAAEGGAPEVVTHSEQPQAASEELSPEERAVHVEGISDEVDEDRKDYADEDADTAALAEGRAAPPTSMRDDVTSK